MKKKELSVEDLINLWMVPYYGMTIQRAYESEPWTDSHEFYGRFQCTQEQHDEWNAVAKEMFRKHFKIGKKSIDRFWALPYLNCSPMVKQ